MAEETDEEERRELNAEMESETAKGSAIPEQETDSNEGAEENEEDFPEQEETGDKKKKSKEQKQTKLYPGLQPMRIIEAALFLANRPLTYADLAMTANNVTVKEAKRLCEELKKEYDNGERATELVMEENDASFEVRPQYLAPIAKLSKQIDLSRKSTRILALIAKKGQVMQSSLKKYFRGEIYLYVHELKEHGYITSEKQGNSRLLKLTKLFHETFQMSGQEKQKKGAEKNVETEEASAPEPTTNKERE